ncbi:MAG: carboxypeptidase-like regulatory domain-containing protein [Planctomycetota bacterium]
MSVVAVLAVCLLTGVGYWLLNTAESGDQLPEPLNVSQQIPRAAVVLPDVTESRSGAPVLPLIAPAVHAASDTARAQPAVPGPEHDDFIRQFDVQVVDERGNPPPWAEIFVYPPSADAGSTPSAVGPPQTYRADQAGRCSLRAHLRSVFVAARGNAASSEVWHLSDQSLKARLGLESLGAEGAAKPVQVMLHLKPVAFLRGVVNGVDGRPVPGATIRCRSVNSDKPWFAAEGHVVATADGLGRFWLSTGQLLVTWFDLWAESGGAETPDVRVQLAPGTVGNVELVFGDVYEIRGLVSGVSGVATLVTIRATSCSKLEDQSDATAQKKSAPREASLDANGSYRLKLTLPGEYYVTAGGADRAQPDPISVMLSRPGQVQRVDFTLQQASVIAGRVLSAEAVPLQGLKLLAQRRDLPAGSACDFDTLLLRAYTKADGTFSLGPASPGRHYDLTLQHSDGSLQDFGGVPAGTRSLELVAR